MPDGSPYALAAPGDLLWMQLYNSSGMIDDAYDVAIDSTNNIYWAGLQQTNGGDMFLRKYDVNGNFQWMQTYNSGGAQQDVPFDVAMDSNNNVYVVGYQRLPGPNLDMFLRKYDVNGNFQWMRTYDTGGWESGYGVAVDSNNNVYVTGNQSTNGGDMFLRKYDVNGNFQWMRTYNSGGGYDIGNSVVIDSNNNVYVAGRHPTNGGDMFLRKYDVNGNFQWMRTYNSGGTQYDVIYDAAVDSTDNIYMAGRQPTNGRDMLLTKHDVNGNFQWAQTYNSGGLNDTAYGVAVDSTDSIYVTGLQSTNGGDMFLRKYDVNGNFQWMRTHNSGGSPIDYDIGFGIAVDSNNNLDIVGFANLGFGLSVLWQYDGGGGSGGGGVDCGVRMYDSTATVTLTCEDPPVSPLRIYQGTKTYGISVVDPADANATRFRIQTPSGVKALRKQ